MPGSTTSITPRHWVLLFFACMVMFGNYYSYDLPGALNVQLQKWLDVPYEEYQYQLNLLYSVYSMPNILLPLIGGLLVDKLGPKYMIILFSSCICLGSAVFSFGVSQKQFVLMVVGRFLFGLGGESLEVAQSRITTDWFKGRGLGMALGLNLSFARIATALNDNASPWIESVRDVGSACWFGLVVCLVSFVSAMIVLYLNRPSSRLLAGIESAGNSNETEPLLADQAEDESELSSVDYLEEDENVHFAQVRGLGIRFWLLCLVTITLYGSVVPFFHICTDFFQHKWYAGDTQMAGFVMSIPDFVSAIGSPVCGIIADRFGKRASMLPVAGLIIVISHSLFAFTNVTPVFSIFVLGLAYSMFAGALWPCVPYLVGRHQIATAYGLVTVALNISLFFFPLFVAKLRTLLKDDFSYVEYFFIVLALVGTAISYYLKVLDDRVGGKLEMSAAQLHLLEVQGDIEIEITEDGASIGGSPYIDTGRKLSRTVTIVDDIYKNHREDDITVKVVGEGVSVPVPSTLVPHHYHAHRSTSPVLDHRQGYASDTQEFRARIKTGKVRRFRPSRPDVSSETEQDGNDFTPQSI